MRHYKALRNLMFEQEITQEDLARALGVSCQTIGRCINGRRPFEIPVAYKILELLGIPDDQLHIYFPRDGFPPAEKSKNKSA